MFYRMSNKGPWAFERMISVIKWSCLTSAARVPEFLVQDSKNPKPFRFRILENLCLSRYELDICNDHYH